MIFNNNKKPLNNSRKTKDMIQRVTIVQFNDGRIFTFGCIAAIYEKFTVEEIGMTKEEIYGRDMPIVTPTCKIWKSRIIPKKQRK
jgi:hypothetical protein